MKLRCIICKKKYPEDGTLYCKKCLRKKLNVRFTALVNYVANLKQGDKLKYNGKRKYT